MRGKKIKIGFCQGYVLGGGLGHAMSYDVRYITPQVKLAMPEVNIAFFPDVGARYFLSRYFSKALHRFLSITGYMLDAQDAIHYGLADGVLPYESFEVCIDDLLSKPWQDILSVKKIIQPQLITVDPYSILDGRSGDVEALFDIDDFDLWYKKIKETEWFEPIKKASPLSIWVIFHTILHELSLKSVTAACHADFALVQYMMEQDDFKEGIRTRIIDKNAQPTWVVQDFPNPKLLLNKMDKAVYDADLDR